MALNALTINVARVEHSRDGIERALDVGDGPAFGAPRRLMTDHHAAGVIEGGRSGVVENGRLDISQSRQRGARLCRGRRRLRERSPIGRGVELREAQVQPGERVGS